MFGDAQPVITAVQADLLTDPSGFRGVAWAVERALRRHPLWLVVEASPRLRGGAGAEAMRRLADDAAWEPRPLRPAEATLAVLERHLADAGLALPRLRTAQAALVPRRAAALLAAGEDGLPQEGLDAALWLAREAGLSRVLVWGRAARGSLQRCPAGFEARAEDPLIY